MTGKHWTLGVFAVLVGWACSESTTDPAAPGMNFDRGGHPRHGWRWSEPVNLGPIINTDATEFQASLSPDELSLYFASNRTGGQGGNDLWVARRRSRRAPWGAPVNLGTVINTSSAENAPTFTPGGHRMYFHSTRPGGFGENDLYVSYRADAHDDLAWESPINLGPFVNTAAFEAGAEIFQADRKRHRARSRTATLYFNRRLGSADDPPFYDFLSAPLGADGLPTAPATPIAELNTPYNEAGLEVSADGLMALFQSTRPGTFGSGDLWITARATTRDAWSLPKNLGAPVNTALNDRHPALSHNGRTLIFNTSGRPGGFGGDDLWMTTRQGANGEY